MLITIENFIFVEKFVMEEGVLVMERTKSMQFECPPLSYWVDSTASSKYPALDKNIQVDVAVVGGGMAGILTSHLLNIPGMRIAVLEADRILQGTTGHTTAKITSQHGIIYQKVQNQMGREFAAQYADANEAAIRLIEQMVRDNDISCDYMKQCAYNYTLEESNCNKLKEEAEIAAALGIKASYLETLPLPFPVRAALCFENQAQFHPLKFMRFIAEKAAREGVQIYEQSRVVALEEKEDQCYTLTTAQGYKIMADKVVIASHYPFWNKASFYFTRLHTDRSYVVAVQAKEKYPQGMYICEEEPVRSLRSQKIGQKELILIGGEHHKTGQGDDARIHYQKLIDFARETYTIEAVSYRWSAQDCMTLDGIPYIGCFSSRTPNLYIATGFGKWGMTNSAASAMILRDLILEGKSRWQEVYDPSRHTIAASTKNFVVENLNVAGKIIGGKIFSGSEDADVKPGEARIMEQDGQRVGIYRDRQGFLHKVDTTCQHMGCELSWNAAEETWDCPCHGSRFSVDGEIIEGPAVQPLDTEKKINPLGKLLKEDF